jgi:hypothetical protein
MATATLELAAMTGGATVLVAFLCGLLVAGALVAAVSLGMRVKDKELPTPSAEEQTKLPATGAVREMREIREPDEVPHADGRERLMPYQLKQAGTRRCADQQRRRWQPGSSGSFGSGSGGRV